MASDKIIPFPLTHAYIKNENTGENELTFECIKCGHNKFFISKGIKMIICVRCRSGFGVYK